jgi:hypothetical protein
MATGAESPEVAVGEGAEVFSPLLQANRHRNGKMIPCFGI